MFSQSMFSVKVFHPFINILFGCAFFTIPSILNRLTHVMFTAKAIHTVRAFASASP